MIPDGLSGKLLADGAADRSEALACVDAPAAALFDLARRVREARRGRKVRLCSIANARAGACGEDCAFCAQSGRHPAGITSTPLLDEDALVAAALRCRDRGLACFCFVTSGAALPREGVARIAAAARRVLAEAPMTLGASLGLLDAASFRLLREAGIRHYNHNLETSRRFFPSVCSTHTWGDRQQTVRLAVACGLEACSGGIFGLGETWEDRVDLALALRDLGVGNVPVNFLHPVAGTRLGDRAPLPAEEALRILAILRLLLPDAVLRVCGGRPTVLGDRQDEVFAAGADALLTGDYLTTPGFSIDADLARIRAAGLEAGN